MIMRILFLLFSLGMTLGLTAQDDNAQPPQKQEQKEESKDELKKEATDKSKKKKQTKQEEEKPVAPGYVHVIATYEIDQLMARYRVQNQNNPYVMGYRIHITQSTKSNQVLSLKNRAERLFPEFETFYEYIQPYFKLRIGGFAERTDAYRALRMVRVEFPSAFLARDRIHLYEDGNN